MPSCASQDGVDNEKENQNVTTSPNVKVDDNANMDDVPRMRPTLPLAGDMVAIASATVMNIFLVWLPHLWHLVIRREGY